MFYISLNDCITLKDGLCCETRRFCIILDKSEQFYVNFLTFCVSFLTFHDSFWIGTSPFGLNMPAITFNRLNNRLNHQNGKFRAMIQY